MTASARPRRLLYAMLTLLVLTVGMVACSGQVSTLQGQSDTEGAGGAGVAGSPPAEESLSVDEAAPRSAGPRDTATGGTTAVGLLPRDVIQRATLTVRTRRVGQALQRVRVVVAGVQGMVADEHTVTTPRGVARRSTLTLRVPATAFDQAVRDVGALGDLQTQQVTTQDVSTEVVDVDARVLSAERTLRRIRELLEEAGDFSDVLSLEAELARREADLASLKAQQAYLEDQTSMSTISLTLLPPRKVSEPPSEDEPAGFVGGLRVGWDALVGVVSTVLTAVGVLVPLLLVLVPLGLLTWVLVRRLLRRPPAPATEPPTP
jgi:Domain of unknown function (DUF4349)